MYDHCQMYAGVGEEIGLEESTEKLMHQHWVQVQDGEEFWNENLAYLHLEQLLKSPFEAKRIERRATSGNTAQELIEL